MNAKRKKRILGHSRVPESTHPLYTTESTSATHAVFINTGVLVSYFTLRGPLRGTIERTAVDGDMKLESSGRSAVAGGPKLPSPIYCNSVSAPFHVDRVVGGRRARRSYTATTSDQLPSYSLGLSRIRPARTACITRRALPATSVVTHRRRFFVFSKSIVTASLAKNYVRRCPHRDRS